MEMPGVRFARRFCGIAFSSFLAQNNDQKSGRPLQNHAHPDG